MLKEVAEVYTEAVVDQAVEYYGVSRAELALIDSNTDVVYEYTHAGTSYILKLIHSSQASHDLVCAEVDWVNYLAERDVPVSRPVRSKDGKLVEVVQTGATCFNVVVYQKAEGVHVGYEEDVHNAPMFQTCGHMVGRMHALAQEYTPSHPTQRRPDWCDLRRRERFPPALDDVYTHRERLAAYTETLPKDRRSYGMIHSDFHAYNFMVHAQGITVFDFAECCYSWFVHDIAIVLYHVLDLPYLGEDYQGFGSFFMENFLPAYRQENRLDQRWAAEMNTFLKLREITTYAYIFCNWDYAAYPEVVQWMDESRQRIDHDLPIVDLEYQFG